MAHTMKVEAVNTAALLDDWANSAREIYDDPGIVDDSVPKPQRPHSRVGLGVAKVDEDRKGLAASIINKRKAREIELPVTKEIKEESKLSQMVNSKRPTVWKVPLNMKSQPHPQIQAHKPQSQPPKTQQPQQHQDKSQLQKQETNNTNEQQKRETQTQHRNKKQKVDSSKLVAPTTPPMTLPISRSSSQHYDITKPPHTAPATLKQKQPAAKKPAKKESESDDSAKKEKNEKSETTKDEDIEDGDDNASNSEEKPQKTAGKKADNVKTEQQGTKDKQPAAEKPKKKKKNKKRTQQKDLATLK